MRTIQTTRSKVEQIEREILRRTQGISAQLDQLITNLEEDINALQNQLKESTSQLERQLTRSHQQTGLKIDQSKVALETRIGLIQEQILLGISTLEGLVIASREFAATTKLLLAGEIAAVASEVGVVLALVETNESSILYSRRVLLSDIRQPRSQLLSQIGRSEDR